MNSFACYFTASSAVKELLKYITFVLHVTYPFLCDKNKVQDFIFVRYLFHELFMDFALNVTYNL